MNDFLLIIQFMTRIPIKKSLSCEKSNFRNGAMFLPVVGFIVGLIQWVIYLITAQFLPMNLSAIFIVLTGIFVTGALHLDGIGDTCDGFFSKEIDSIKIIEIMKDSRIGIFSCVAVIFDILIKYAAISNLSNIKASLVIIAAPVIGRMCIIFISFIGNTAKATGTGNFFIGNIGKLQLVISLIIGYACALLFTGIIRGCLVILASIVLTVLFNIFCTKKIGGITGDSLGTTNELIEMLVLLICCVHL